MSLRDLRTYTFAALLTLVPLFALTTFVAPDDAEAQGTGGSFGGGDWSSGGGGGGGGGTDWGSGGSGGWGSGGTDWGSGSGGYTPSYGGGGGGGGGIGCGGFCCIVFIIGFVLVAMIISNRRRGGGGGPGMGGMGGPGMGGMGGPGMGGMGGPGMGGMGGPGMGGMPMGGGYAGPNAMYITSLSLGLDWRARAQLQAQLKRLAETGDTRSPGGLAQLLSETVLALRRSEMSWLYASYKDEGAHAPQNAQPLFSRIAQEYRARFQSELVRGASGGLQQQDAPAMTAKATEGEGTVVVTIVLASRRPMQGFHVHDAAQIRNALADRGGLQGPQMVALEVIWSPAAENDRMSTAELETVYPELKLIDPNSIAGRIFCAYCNGPFPAELLNCTHCGAPAEASKGRRTPRG
jgi:hypothetical protein